MKMKTVEESQRIHQPKCSKYKNEDENNSQNILSEKNYQASFQKFRQIIHTLVCIYIIYLLVYVFIICLNF